ncbi:hypothetical protein [uncultured Tateyamaria sp.]|uniref:hypothetical protein n=1 Tax=uncultured Tateyamaria sp. TaxID=455651 RepID=UPI00260A427F|nr:hypothetical protein [uncultured Tateyamaria sp.]
MHGTCPITDELAYLVGCGLEPYGGVFMDAVECGQRLTLDDDADLAIVLTGDLRAAWRCGFSVELSGPTVILQSDVRKTYAYATRDLRMLSMTNDMCTSVLTRHRAFRGLFFDALTARIQALAAVQARPAMLQKQAGVEQ